MKVPYALVLVAVMGIPAAALADSLPLPKSVVIDRSIPALQSEAMSLAARRYYAFWDTGDVAYANAALAPDFVDRNLPAGRPQGPKGPVFASKNFRIAVPDLHVEVEEMLLVDDRVIGRLRFSGQFTGTFGNGAAARQGDGRATLLQQLGAVPQ
jgi:predicted ester cyclase